MPGRAFSAQNKYRYGFNGKELDGDLESNNYDYGFRIYNSKIAKFLSVDPLQAKYPELTPYQFTSNSPIQGVDLDGREIYHYTLIQNNSTTQLRYDGMQTRWDGVFDDVRHWKTFSGDKINGKSIVVARGEGEAAWINFGVGFRYFKELNDWKAAGYPVTPAEVASREVLIEEVGTITGFGMGGIVPNEGHLSLESKNNGKPKASSPINKTNEVAIAAHSGTPEAAKPNTSESDSKFNLKDVNKIKGTNNCVNCSIATDNYLKGNNSSALNSGPKSISILEKEFNQKFTYGLTIEGVQAKVSKPGQTGIVFGNRGAGNVGHVFNVINQNGKINFIDGQTGKGASVSGQGYINFGFLPTK